MAPALISSRVITIVDNLLEIGIETHDFLADRGRAAVNLLMREVEDLASGQATPIVKQTLCQHTDECRLARVYITNHCDSHIILIPTLIHFKLQILQVL